MASFAFPLYLCKKKDFWCDNLVAGPFDSTSDRLVKSGSAACCITEEKVVLILGASLHPEERLIIDTVLLHCAR